MLCEQLGGDDDVEVARAVMRGVQNATDHFGIADARLWRGQMQIEAVDFILQLALGVLQPIHNGVQGRINEIVHVLGTDSGDLRLRSQLRRNDSDHVAPLFVEFDVFADRRTCAKQAFFSGRPKNADRRSGGIFRAIEKAAFGDAQMADLQITWLNAVNDGSVLLRLWEKLARSKTLAWSSVLNVGDIFSDDLVINESQSRGGFPHLLQLLPIGRFLGLDNKIADAELFDEGHDFLLGARSDGEHGHNRGDAKNHAQHGQKGTQLVAGQVFEAEGQIGQPLLQGPRLGDGTGIHDYPLSLISTSDPGWDSRFHCSCCLRRRVFPDSQARRPFLEKCP